MEKYVYDYEELRSVGFDERRAPVHTVHVSWPQPPAAAAQPESRTNLATDILMALAELLFKGRKH